MGRPEILTIAIREFITRIKKTSPEMKARDVIAKVKDDLIDNYPTLNGNWTRDRIEKIVEDELLSESAIIKYLTELNKNLAKLSKLDQPWHLGALNDYPIQAEAIPPILDVQNWSEFQKQKQSINKDDIWLTFNHFDMSIRQAYWIARLYALIDWSKVKKNKKSLEGSLYWLWTWSKVYALKGMICWLSDIDPPDTSNIDKALREGWSAYVLGYDYFLAPQEKNTPGIMNTLSDSYSAADSLLDIIKNQSEVKNERPHNTTK